MNTVVLTGSQRLGGNVKAPPSKSETIREVIASTLSRGASEILGPLSADDTNAARRCCQALGARITVRRNSWKIWSDGRIRCPRKPLNCIESATTLRFLAAVGSSAPGIVVLTGKESLLKRPIGLLLSSLRQLGVDCFTEEGDIYPPVLNLGGGLDGGDVNLRGDESSQYVSALLFASPQARREVKISLTTPLESTPYVNLTLRTLKDHGIQFKASEELNYFEIRQGQEYRPISVSISGDYSSISFLLVSAVITDSRIKVGNLRRGSGQADERIVQILKNMGVKISLGSDFLSIMGVPERLVPMDIDVRDCPDLTPALAVLACFADGTSILRGTRRLRIKESDRVSVLVSELSKMGVEIKSKDDQLVIEGLDRLRGAVIESHGDHRIAMAGVTAALAAEGTSQIIGAQTISKSYPNFLQDLKILGAKLDVR
ncbi:MAG: 3-phosphoshikimate 1-carboxyvinyltransferase [Candidatus Bathyarchaeota archaeon]|nr:MAG: 3-phosphoshikimate 1-carboxyvinyltransferase [Candidatus Bathyarchaeota archaeon]